MSGPTDFFWYVWRLKSRKSVSVAWWWVVPATWGQKCLPNPRALCFSNGNIIAHPPGCFHGWWSWYWAGCWQSTWGNTSGIHWSNSRLRESVDSWSVPYWSLLWLPTRLGICGSRRWWLRSTLHSSRALSGSAVGDSWWSWCIRSLFWTRFRRHRLDCTRTGRWVWGFWASLPLWSRLGWTGSWVWRFAGIWRFAGTTAVITEWRSIWT